MAVTSFAPAAAGLQPYEQVFTSSGTWTKPDNVKTCEVTVVGGGGGGWNNSIGGGAGGYYKSILDLTGVTSATVTVGAGGVYSTVNTAVAGGSSSFVANNGISITAAGGSNYTLDASVGSQGAIYNPSQFGPYALGSGNQYPGVTGGSYTDSAGLIGYGNGKYVMLPFANRGTNYGTTQCYYSTNGTTWSPGTNLASARNFSDVAYGNGVFVAIRPNSTPTSTTVITSSDGINWTETNVTMSGDKLIFANGVFVTAGGNSSSQGTSWWSANGTTWTQGTVTRNITGSETSIWYGRPMWNGTKFIQIHSNGSYWTHTYQSNDGKAWTQVNNTGANGNFFLSPYNDAFYANGVYLASFTNSVSSIISRSTDGSSWNTVNLPSGMYSKRFEYVGGIYFVIGFDVNGNQNRVAYSLDAGQNWSTFDLRNSSGTIVSSTEIGYLGSMATNGTDLIIVSDSKEGGSGGSGGGVWKAIGYKAIKLGKLSTGSGSMGGSGEGSIAEQFHSTYNPYPMAGLGSVEGFCRGGEGPWNSNNRPTNFGDGGGAYGAMTPSSNRNGYQGAVILRWWA